MFGLFRWLLAVCVIAEHVPSERQFHPGDTAVICFFMLSGYVMTLLLRRHYSGLGRPTLFFYIDRLLRIYPQYLLFLILTQVSLLWFQFTYFPWAFSGANNLFHFFINALIVPMSYTRFWPVAIDWLFIPQSWSLGLEEQFYWLFPFLVFKRWLGRIAMLASFAVFAFAMFGFLDAENWAYRILPGVLFVFLLGKNLAELNQSQSREALWTIAFYYLGCVCLLGLTLTHPAMQFRNNLDVLRGLVIGFPILAGLSRLPRRNWDDWFGHTSYGVFLSHILVFNYLEHWQIFPGYGTDFFAAGVLGATLCGLVAHLSLERFSDNLRYHLRDLKN